MCPRYFYTFVFEYLTGEWSFYCIYADNLEAAKKDFYEIFAGEFIIVTKIERKGNWYLGYEEGFEEEVCLFDIRKEEESGNDRKATKRIIR